ncbi:MULTISPECIES: MarR family winged helix-turn-helix transcriptional regulator [Pseudonocardia]|uniref:HTH marR-type domain-containing protein n=2 Tax=Pseudonocardia TaxID=1847 RepID=A0ABQ0S0D0_9PSEU|nr:MULTISPECIES: MarR family transcriptional regulator [Pseudonocardia]OSY40101.1 putative HTH-type transcriptional regulator YusO [Pseudonocardia autotrophica]TDN72953.1 DNA-binding MarR family transcriptional regulator [Pseudonocardia autotrophica]BBG03673.1 hypothetical protein Pdca_48820 [Pseudonocardia autotrophica]GEC26371.1 hypothetical protein PSA01_34000 [Pseudonocardia saturnea]
MPEASEQARAVLAGVHAFAHGIDRYRLAVGTRFGLGVPEVVTLTHLAMAGPARAGEVAERTGLSQGSVTALVDRLERRGLVARLRPRDNRRIVLVELTGAGRELTDGLLAAVLPSMAATAAEPGLPEPADLAHGLHRVADMLVELADRDPAQVTPAG